MLIDQTARWSPRSRSGRRRRSTRRNGHAALRLEAVADVGGVHEHRRGADRAAPGSVDGESLRDADRDRPGRVLVDRREQAQRHARGTRSRLRGREELRLELRAGRGGERDAGEHDRQSAAATAVRSRCLLVIGSPSYLLFFLVVGAAGTSTLSTGLDTVMLPTLAPRQGIATGDRGGTNVALQPAGPRLRSAIVVFASRYTLVAVFACFSRNAPENAPALSVFSDLKPSRRPRSSRAAPRRCRVRDALEVRQQRAGEGHVSVALPRRLQHLALQRLLGRERARATAPRPSRRCSPCRRRGVGDGERAPAELAPRSRVRIVLGVSSTFMSFAPSGARPGVPTGTSGGDRQIASCTGRATRGSPPGSTKTGTGSAVPADVRRSTQVAACVAVPVHAVACAA